MNGPAISLRDCAKAVGNLLEDVFGQLEQWRGSIEPALAGISPQRLDTLVSELVTPTLSAPDSLLAGAGFVSTRKGGDRPSTHFAWWLGPVRDNPLFGTTSEPTRLDLAAREYVDYMRNFEALEWFSVPKSTQRRHVTGPYVDHLCICDYILTLTVPVEAPGVGSDRGMAGVVGADVTVRRLEREILPLLRALRRPVSMVNEASRVVISTDPATAAGVLLTPGVGESEECPGTPFRLVEAHGDQSGL